MPRLRYALPALLCLAFAANARAELLQLGTQDFADGQILPCFSACSSGWFSASDPFNQFLGSDPGIPGAAQFSAEWSFDLSALSLAQLRSLRLEIGLFDHDSSAPGSQIDSFTSAELGDLKPLLDSAFEAAGRGDQQEYNVFSIEIELLPTQLAARNLAESKRASFTLRLKGPVYIEDERTRQPVLAQGTNGAGLDFVRLTLISGATAPEPASLLLLVFGGAATAAARRRR
jgi:hypothetical protein